MPNHLLLPSPNLASFNPLRRERERRALSLDVEASYAAAVVFAVIPLYPLADLPHTCCRRWPQL
jgi:hypothetical protein